MKQIESVFGIELFIRDNDFVTITPDVKNSGVGREAVRSAILEMAEPHLLTQS